MRKIVSIDIETTGVDFENCQILSFGAVIINLDTKEKDATFYATLKPPRAYYFEPYALNLNRELSREIHNSLKFSSQNGKSEEHSLQTLKELESNLKKWLKLNDIDYSDIKVVGKNFTEFDKKFLNRDLPEIGFNRRVFDIGSAVYNPNIDSWIPSLTECLERFNLNNTVTHNALEDAELVADLVLEICTSTEVN